MTEAKKASGPTITAKDKPTPEIEIELKEFTLAETAKAILEKTLRNPRVDTKDKS